MTRILIALLLVYVLFTVYSSGPARSIVQQDQPVAVISGGLVNPRSIAFDLSGLPFVVEAGSGGEIPGTVALEPPVGPILGGPTGSVSTLADGCPMAIATDLPSARNALGDTFGPSAIAILDGRTFILVSGGGEANGNPGQPSGIYELTDGVPVLLVDLGSWFDENPTAAQPTVPVISHGLWTSMATLPDESGLLIVEQGAGQIVRVELDGAVDRVADLSTEGDAPSSIAIAPDGSILAGMMTAEPFATGSAYVLRIDADGKTETVWSGLTMISGLAVDADGVIYASQFSESRDRPPFFIPGTGSIVRQTGPETSELVIDQLNFPGGIAFDTDASLSALVSTFGSDTGTGIAISIDVGSSLPIHGEAIDLTPPSCVATTQAVEVVIDDLGINPSTITIAPGTTVTWRIGGEFDHAVASDPSSPMAFDSGILAPGSTFTVTFTEPGVYLYFDGLYPERTGEIVVAAT